MRRTLWLVVILMLGALPALADVKPPEVPYENKEYNGKFTFVRIRFDPQVWGMGPYAWGLDLKWNHDYPYAEENLMEILQELTSIDPSMGAGNILEADDPELFDYPLAYICEVGFWNPDESEATALREYMLKGGFLIVDDFSDMRLGGGRAFRNFERQLAKVLPEGRLVELDVSPGGQQPAPRSTRAARTHRSRGPQADL